MEHQHLPIVVHAEYRGGYLIDVEFDNGIKKLIDFEQWFNGPIFEPLKDKANFRKFFLDGWTVAWPNGADIAPETLYEAESYSENLLKEHQYQAVD